MNDKNFKKLIETLNIIKIEMPDLRISYVLQASVDTAKQSKNKDISDLSDKELANSVEKFYIQETRKRAKGVIKE